MNDLMALSQSDLREIYRALLLNDGSSLRPELPIEKQRQLSASLDKLRYELLTRLEVAL